MSADPDAHFARTPRESRVFKFRTIAALLIGWHILGGLLAVFIGKMVLQIFTLTAGAVIAIMFLIGPVRGRRRGR